MQKIYVREVTIPHFTKSRRRQIASLVDRSLESLSMHSPEDDIESILYDAFGLNADEIEHIEKTMSIVLTTRRQGGRPATAECAQGGMKSAVRPQ